MALAVLYTIFAQQPLASMSKKRFSQGCAVGVWVLSLQSYKKIKMVTIITEAD